MAQGMFSQYFCSFLICCMYQNGNPARNNSLQKYERLAERRENLMKDYDKGCLSEKKFLEAMGSISLKAEREAYRFRADVESQVEKSSHIEASVEESAVSLVASFSETRTWSQSESEESKDENVVFSKSQRPQRISAKKTTRKEVPKCYICSKGFMMKKNLHLQCTVCLEYVHKRHLEDCSQPFTCVRCLRPSTAALPPVTQLEIVSLTAGVETSSETLPTSQHQSETSGDRSLGQQVSPGHQSYQLTPTFRDHNDQFNERIRSLGFERREDTPADGNCAIHAILDQYNLQFSANESFFGREDALFARRLVAMEIKKSLVQGRADTGFFGGDPHRYCEKMKKDGEYVDNIFLSYFAEYIGCDLVLIHANAETASNGVYTLIYGGGVGTERHGQNCPIFLGFFEPTVYGENGGHYQSIYPTRNNEVLQSILDHGGFDVAKYLQLDTEEEEDVTLEETTAFQPTSSSTVSSKRNRSPESSSGLSVLRAKFRRCGESWKRLSTTPSPEEFNQVSLK